MSQAVTAEKSQNSSKEHHSAMFRSNQKSPNKSLQNKMFSILGCFGVSIFYNFLLLRCNQTDRTTACDYLSGPGSPGHLVIKKTGSQRSASHLQEVGSEIDGLEWVEQLRLKYMLDNVG